ncbi:MAG: GAF domain-containing protein, partial [Acidobacteriota bacterium]
MKISHKLILSFLLVGSFTGVTTLFALHSYNSIDRSFDNLINDPTAMLATLNDLKQAGVQIVSSTGEFTFAKDEGGWDSDRAMAEEEEQLRVNGQEAFQRSLQRFDALVGTVAGDEVTTLRNIATSGNNLIETSREMIELKKNNVRGGEILDKRATLERDEMVYLQYVNAALERESREQLEAQQDVQSTIAISTRGTIIVTAFTFLLAIFAGFYISHLLSKRVIKLQEAIRLVGIGELDTQIETQAKDEIGELARSFNGMVGDLKAADETLRESEERHRKLFESNPFPMWVYDTETYGFLAVNDAATKHYRYSREEFLAMTLKDIRPAEDFALLLDHRANVYSKDNPSSIWKHRRKDGTTFDVEVTAYPLVFDERPAELVLANDITERIRLEAESRIISEIIHGVTTTANLDELLAVGYRWVSTLLNVENCFLALLDPETDTLKMQFFVDKFDTATQFSKIGNGLTAYVFRTQTPVLLNSEAIQGLRDEGEIEMIGTAPAVWMGVPLRAPNGIIGVMAVQNYEDPNAYDQRDLDFLTSVADQMAMAIQRKLADEALRESEERYREIIENA